MNKTKISGTREWSVASVNCINGCSHRCRYCYARAAAVRRKLCPSNDAWGTTFHQLQANWKNRGRKRFDGRVMFPTTHDIEPQFLWECIHIIGNILDAGNEILIVTKPHLECVKTICNEFAKEKDRILFRFSIGAISDRILQYWEPGAPSFDERLDALKIAHYEGFATSLSAEPLLESGGVGALVNATMPFITDTIWIGKMNKPRQRCPADTDTFALCKIEAGQTNAAIFQVYCQLRNNPKIRWKESYKEVLGLPPSTEAGMDE